MRTLHPTRRRRSGLLAGGLLAAVTALTITGCSSSTAHSAAADSAPGLLAKATANARAEQWAHLQVTDRLGTETGTISQDSGPGEGRQDIHRGQVAAQVIWVATTAYITGNAQAITSYFGFPAADGPTLAGHWISIPSTSQDYGAVTAGVSLDSALSETGLTGSLTETGRTTRDGQTVIGIHGTASSPDTGRGPATLYVTDGARPLPVEFDTTAVQGGSGQGTEHAVFSNWDRPVSLTAPADAKPAAPAGAAASPS